MTRSSWVTVRLPGASTVPATRTRMRFHTGAVKQGRNPESQSARIGGTGGGLHAVLALGWCDAIAGVESKCTRAARVLRAAPRHPPAERSIMRRHDRSDHPAYRALPMSPWATGCRTPQPRLHALPRTPPACPSRGCAQPDKLIVSRCSTGRSGRNAGPAPGRSGGPSCPSTTRCGSSLQRTSSGQQDSFRAGQKCGKSSSAA